MRPIDPGPWPLDAETGEEVRYAKYQNAKRHLHKRVGKYCCFCERPVQSGLEVEHVRAKQPNPALLLTWTNFLLACKNCNATKGTKIKAAADEDAYLLPHRDRTLDAFDYTAGAVRIARRLPPDIDARARATDKLVGLTRTAQDLSEDQLLGATDTRYEDRRLAWKQATWARAQLREQDTPIVRGLIVANAQGTGFWSVWMCVFRDDPEMQAALSRAFLGTEEGRVYPLPAHALPVGAPLAETRS